MRLSHSKQRSSGDNNESDRPEIVGSEARGGGIPSSTSMKTKKRAADAGDLHSVRVKRERVDSGNIDEDQSRTWSESDAVAKAENVEVPCKVETTEAAGAFKSYLVHRAIPR